MAFTRGKYGIIVQSTPEPVNRLPWLIGAALAFSLAGFIGYKIWGGGAKHEPPVVDAPKPVVIAPQPVPQPQPAEEPKTVVDEKQKQLVVTPTPTPSLPRPKPMPTVAPQMRPLVARILDSLERRPAGDVPLLRRYVEAEAQEREDLVIDTLKKLVDRPSLADLQNDFLHRLGDLNFKRLFSSASSTWVTTAKVRPGDGRERIARAHGTTTLIIERLNPQTNWDRLKPGDTLRVLDFPTATLVVNRDGTADLTLLKNERFFRRYDISRGSTTKSGVFTVDPSAGTTLRKLIRELGLVVTPTTRKELEMFLASGSRIVVK